MKRHRPKKHYDDRQHRPVITYPAQKEGRPDLATRKRRNMERRQRAQLRASARAVARRRRAEIIRCQSVDHTV